MRYLYLFFALVFALFAAVQYNDPDPVLWIAIYGYAVLMSVMAYKGKFNSYLLLIGIAGYLAGAIYYFPPSVEDWIHAEQQAQSLQMKMPFVEEARESLGLFMAFAVLTFYYLKARAANTREVKNQTA
jgi:hypothetical protein